MIIQYLVFSKWNIQWQWRLSITMNENYSFQICLSHIAELVILVWEFRFFWNVCHKMKGKNTFGAQTDGRCWSLLRIRPVWFNSSPRFWVCMSMQDIFVFTSHDSFLHLSPPLPLLCFPLVSSASLFSPSNCLHPLDCSIVLSWGLIVLSSFPQKSSKSDRGITLRKVAR